MDSREEPRGALRRGSYEESGSKGQGEPGGWISWECLIWVVGRSLGSSRGLVDADRAQDGRGQAVLMELNPAVPAWGVA